MYIGYTLKGTACTMVFCMADTARGPGLLDGSIEGMTLATRVLIVDPTPYHPIFEEARRLIGGEHGKVNEEPGCIENAWGQGFPSYIGVTYGADAPLTDDCPPEDHEDGGCGYPVERWSIEVRLDTAYGYRGPKESSCDDLHASIVHDLGRWLSDRGLTWYWYHEYTGEWHPSSDPLTILGDPDRGRLR